ncbi:MAG TPA: amidase family protein [Chloroflexota bacterium]|nr:amidase family protein [Chloroflexota bacterium]
MGTAVDELCALSAVEARRRIGTKELSPVELLEACIARIEQVNPAVNAVTATDFGRARAAARAAEAAVLAGEPLSLLHGLPVGVKDLQDTAGLLTTYGSPIYRDYVPAEDEAMVGRVRAAGGVIFCKTNTPEFGAGANTRNPIWGATGNPFDPMRNVGGSSGGSAAALATGMMPLATGSDTGGSLRIPAAYAGIVGFRPSPGLVPTNARQLGWSSISVPGPMARTVADVCLLLGAQAAFDSDDPFSVPIDGASFARPEEVDLGSLRCAVSADLGFAPIDAAYKATFEAKVGAFGGLFRSCDREVAPDFGEADRCFEVIRAVQFVARHQETYERDPSLLGPNVRANYEQGATMSLSDFAWAHVEQTRIYRRAQRFFEEYDVLITPTVPITPFPWEQLYLAEMNGEPLRTYFHWLALTYGITLTGHPAVSLPCGVDEQGMPFGLQIVGPHKRDAFTLGVAHALERALARHPELSRPLPDLARLGEETPALRSIVTHPPDNSGA